MFQILLWDHKCNKLLYAATKDTLPEENKKLKHKQIVNVQPMKPERFTKDVYTKTSEQFNEQNLLSKLKF